MHPRGGPGDDGGVARLSWVLGLCVALWAAPTPATPVVDPGDDLPRAGRSLFDHLMRVDHAGQIKFDVPDNYPALRQRIEAQVQHDADAALPGLKQVLIPLGRSLQRLAAAPRFFDSPRTVLAVDEEPVAGVGRSGMLLKDRLYLGHQARADVLEVISYNEAAGRFEFQLVKDFRPGGRPQVVYAKRRLCLACHQNAAPIFSRPTWDETNANPKVAALLSAQAQSFQGVAVNRGVDLPQAIDDATDRANLLGTYQLLWREGCGDAGREARECRAALFVAALQYRLSGGRQFDRRATPALARLARARWPEGLALPNPDIPNRDPLANGSNTSTGTMQADVAAAFDPLALRPALATWSVDDSAALVERSVAGLAGFLAEEDLARIDRQLSAWARRQAPAQRAWTSPCAVMTGPTSPDRGRLAFDCTAATPDGLALAGEVELTGAAARAGRLRHLRVDGLGELRALPLGAGRAVVAGHERRLRLPLQARGADGRSIASLELRWAGANGSARIVVLDDFAPVRAAVRALLDASAQGRYDGFDALPFRRARLMSALGEQLGLPPLRWCCLDTAGLPTAQVDPTAMQPSSAHGAPLPPAAAGFYAQCATCHATPNPTPPNFLWGDSAQVQQQLSQCAERLFVRLAMWQLPPAQRPKTPMPPATALLGAHLTESAWRDGVDLAALSAFARDTLSAASGRAPSLDSLLAGGYDQLRPCLASADTAAR